MFKLTNEVFCILKAGFFMSLCKTFVGGGHGQKCIRESAEQYTQYFD